MNDPQTSPVEADNVADLLGGAFAGHTMQRLRTADGKYRYSYVSSGVQDSFGLDPVALMQMDEVDHAWLHADDRPRFIAALEHSAATLTRLDEEVRVGDAAGGYKWVRSIGSPRRLADGSVIWDGVALDVTDRRDALAALQRTLSQVRQNETSEGRFSYIAASDVLDRLAALRTAVSRLDASDPASADVMTSLAQFERALAAARDLVEGPASQTSAGPSARNIIETSLTLRQREILDHVSRGASNRAIAAAVGISEGTVKLHISAILKRLGVRNRTEAAHTWKSMSGR